MDIASELGVIKDRVKRDIVDAVDSTARLSELVKLLEDIERDTSLLAQLERNVKGYRGRLDASLEHSAPSMQPALDFTGSKKQLGKSARQAFAEAHGLAQVKGRVYANASGSMFGMAMATEAKGGNKWWLGIPDQQFSSIALLCQDGSTWLEFILPSAALTPVWPRLSRSAGEVKFNVKRENLRYVLTVPGYGPFDITRFLGNYGPLAN